jgi:putative FmdB family regulatory protein
MPTYEYECASCGNDFDVFQSMSDAPLKVCPTCGGAVRRKINGGTGIIFKGSGFYKNDSRKPSAPRGSSASGGGSQAKEGCSSCPAAPSGGAAGKDD